MRFNILSALILFYLSLLTSCSNEDSDLNWNDSDVLYFSKIWEEGKHNAFTDLIFYKGFYYCSFREAEAHVSTSKDDYGKIRIIKSHDGVYWTSAGLILNKEYDLRDPCISVTPDGLLMVLYGKASVNEESNKMTFNNTGVVFASNNTVGDLHIGEAKDIFLSRKWLWKVTWHKNIAYGVAYTNGISPILVKSEDGIIFEQICELRDLDKTISNEADLIFTEQDEMIMVIRSNISNGHFGISKAPYNKWEWKPLNEQVHSPKLFYLQNRLFVSGRGRSGRNMLYYINENIDLKPIYTFPGKGESGYPGAIQKEDELWVSYYTTINRTSIYLAKISTDMLLKKIEKYS